MDDKSAALGVAAVVLLLILRELLPWIRTMVGGRNGRARVCEAETVLAVHEKTEAGFFREMVGALQRVEENQRRTADVLSAILDEAHRNQAEVRFTAAAIHEKLTRIEARITS